MSSVVNNSGKACRKWKGKLLIPEPSKELIQQSQNGDLKSFKNLYRHYEKTIYGFCLRMLINQQDAEDAVQTIFLKLFRNLSNFNYEARFTTYLFTIARNACYDILNQRKNMNEDLDKADHIAGNTTDSDHDISSQEKTAPGCRRYIPDHNNYLDV
jgi:DNA-directed RNA polymerase specialized sigma24 family protein